MSLTAMLPIGCFWLRESFVQCEGATTKSRAEYATNVLARSCAMDLMVGPSRPRGPDRASGCSRAYFRDVLILRVS